MIPTKNEILDTMKRIAEMKKAIDEMSLVVTQEIDLLHRQIERLVALATSKKEDGDVN